MEKVFNKIAVSALTFVMATALAFNGFIALPAEAAVGDLVKSADKSTVYIVAADGVTILPFTHERAYLSWGYSNDMGVTPDFSGVMSMSLASYTVGPYVEFRSGTLLRSLTEPDVFYIEDDVKRPIFDETTFLALGLEWDDVEWTTQDFLDDYTMGDMINDTGYHVDGQIIKYADDPALYLLDNGQKRAFQSEAAFEANRFYWNNFVVIPDSETYDDGSMITGFETDLSIPKGVGDAAAQPAAGSGLTVAKSSDNPASTTVVKSAARVPFLVVNLTASSDGDVMAKLVVEREGLSANSNFSSIGFYDGLARIGNLKTLNSQNRVTSDYITVPAGTTKKVTVAGNMASSVNAADEAFLSLKEVDTSADVSGSLPIDGNPMTMNNSITLASLTVAEGSNVGSSTEEVGTEDFEFLNLKLTAQTEDVAISYIKFYNVGSAGENDLDNVELLVDGSVIASSQLDGKYVGFDLSNNPFDLDKGDSETFSLHGDIVDGSGRTFDFDVEKATDIVAMDKEYGFYITPSGALNGGNVITVAAGSINVSKTNDVPASNIVENQSDVELASFMFQVQGEAVDLSQMQFILDVTGTGTSSDITNVTLYDSDGKAVTSAQDPDTNNEVTFTDTVTVPVGDNVYTVRGDLNSDFALNDTIEVYADLVAAANWDATGTVTGESIAETPASTAVQANTQTIKSGSLSYSTSLSPAAQSVVKGTAAWHFADFIFDASGSAEDVKVNSFKVKHYTGVNGKTINVSNIRLKKGGEFLNINAKNGSDTDANDDETYTFNLGSSSITVPEGQQVTLSLYGDLSGSAVTNATHKFALSTTTADIDAEGVDTDQSVSAQTSQSSPGQNMTVSTGGTLATSLDLSSPITKQFVAGTAGNTLAVFKMVAGVEDVELDELLLTGTGAAASSSAADISKLWLCDDSSCFASVTPTSTTSYFAVNDGLFVVPLSQSSGKKLHVKADLANIGTGFVGTSGNQLGFKINAANDVVATGVQSGQGATESGTATGNTHRYFKSVPVVALESLSGDLVAGSNNLFKFNVTASGDDVGLWKVTFYVATSGVAVTNFTLYEIENGVETQVTNATSNMTLGDKDLQTVQFIFDNDLDGTNDGDERGIAGGASKSYVLKATATGVGTGDSITTSLNGDKSQLSNSIANYIWTGTGLDNFIWSDRSVTGHSTSTKDWANGFKVSGLNVSSTSHTLSK